MSRVKVWKYGQSQLVEMSDLKKGDLFHFDKDMEGSNIKREDIMLACEDAEAIANTNEDGPTAAVVAQRLIYDPNFGVK